MVCSFLTTLTTYVNGVTVVSISTLEMKNDTVDNAEKDIVAEKLDSTTLYRLGFRPC